jgi:hypothetical protein
MKLLITGAAGSGTSTLAAALASRFNMTHLEADDYYWLPVEPRYTSKRSAEERQALFLRDLSGATRAVVAGSVMGWGTAVEEAFDGIIFLFADTALRLARLEERERLRFGAPDPRFLAWAAAYDAGPPEGRSLAKHRAWLATRRCKVLCLDGAHTSEAQIDLVRCAWPQLSAVERS